MTHLTSLEASNPESIIEKLEGFARGIINETMERHSFHNRQQEEEEKFDDFLTDIKVLSKNCKFCIQCYPSILRDHIVGGIRYDRIRQKLLADLSLRSKKLRKFAEHQKKQ